MSGKALAVVGMRGMGKSTIVKDMLKPTHEKARFIYDPNGEYTDLYKGPLLPFNEFAEMMPKIRNGVIVVEEATVFLNNRGFNFDFLDVIVRARHANNTVILVFHSFSSIPKYILNLLNMAVILKTGDSLAKVEMFDNPGLTRAFLEIRNAPMLKGKGGVQYSPHKIFDLYDPNNFNENETSPV